MIMAVLEQYTERFDDVGESEADARGRVALGRAGARPGRRYQVRADDDGVIILTPVVSIPEREMLAWENRQLAEQVRAAVANVEATERLISVTLASMRTPTMRTELWPTSCASRHQPRRRFDG
jgi:hypothetical protein